jgi:hypothetical protein
MSRKALLLFAATSVIWGSSFLFIRVSQRSPPPHPMQRSILASMVSRLTRRMRAELVSAGNTHDRRAFRSPTAR